MIKIITATGNPNLNKELKKFKEFYVVGNDILYSDGIIESLEINNEIDYLILSDFFEEKNDIEDLIEKVIEINNKIKIILIINKKNKLLENNLLKRGISDIFYDDEDIIDVINYLKTKNIEYLNMELREEIDSLKRLITEKNNKKNTFVRNNLLKKENKIIGITGARGIGKTTFCLMLANSIKKNNKILIIDFDLINAHIGELFNKKIEYSKIDELNLNNFIIEIDENLDILIGLNILDYYNKLDFSKIKSELNILKKKYNYIIVDTYSEKTYENNKYIYNYFDEVFLLSGLNKIESIKTEHLINLIIKEWKIDNNKIKLIYYRTNFLENMNRNLKANFLGINIIRENKRYYFY